MKVPEPKKLPSGAWRIQLRLGGESISITDFDKDKCKKDAQLTKAEYLAGKRSKALPKNRTLDEILTDYIKKHEKVLSPSTIAGYETIRKNRYKNHINKKAATIDWQQLIDDEIIDKKKPKTIKNGWGLISAALADAGYPVPDVKLPAVMPAVRPWLDEEQIRIFVSEVKNRPCAIPALLALHSLRRSEILGLTWDKIDLKKDIIRVEGAAVPDTNNKLIYREANKTKKSRRNIPIMIPELKTALLAVPKEERKGKVYTAYQNKLWEQVNKVCKDTGLPKVGVHGLRHSFASLAHHVGLPEQEAMLLGGWEDAQTMHKIYEHISEADRLKAENKIKQFFTNAHENAHESGVGQ